MSERIVDNPANHGWVEDNGKWVWEGGATTGHIEDGTIEGQITTWDVAKAEWTPDGAVVVEGGNATFSGAINASNAGSINKIVAFDGANYTALQQEGTTFNIRPQGSGTIGLSMVGTTGDATFSGMVRTTAGANQGVAAFATGSLYIDQATSSASNAFRISSDGVLRTHLDANGDAYFSGTVDAGGFTVNGVPIGGGADLGSYNFNGNDMWTTGNSGVRFNGPAILPLDGSGALTDTGPNIGSSTRKFNNLHLSGTGNATDFVASSDERLKDNITTAPVGLIDSLKGREWDWKESGEKGSGVVAQELEQVLPHLVHTDDEGMKSVSYNGLVAYLIEEVKALRAEVEELKS